MLLINDDQTRELLKFNMIDFEIDKHIYTLNGAKLASVSSCLYQFKPYFAKKQIAAKCAQKEGKDVGSILEEWTVKRDYSAVIGKDFHLFVRYFLNKIAYTPITDIEERIEQFKIFWESYIPTYEIIAAELIVGDTGEMGFGVAGTIDALFKHKVNGTYHIFDWKTNKEIKTENKWQNLKEPLKHIPDCEYYNYSLQLTLYTDILKNTTQLPMGESYLIHFPKAEGFKVYQTYDYAQELPIIKEAIKNGIQTKT